LKETMYKLSIYVYVSNHRLLNDTGRYVVVYVPAIHRDLRLCPMCKPAYHIENERDFLLYCPTFSSLRDSLIWKRIVDNVEDLPSDNQYSHLYNAVSGTIHRGAKYTHIRSQATVTPPVIATASTH
jgi:hypothetical protein